MVYNIHIFIFNFRWQVYSTRTTSLVTVAKALTNFFFINNAINIFFISVIMKEEGSKF